MESALTTAPPSHRRACVPVTVSPRTAASRPRAASSSMRLAGVRRSAHSWRSSPCSRRLVEGRERGARASVRGARRGAPDAHRSAGRFPQSRSRRRGDDLDPRGTHYRDFERKKKIRRRAQSERIREVMTSTHRSPARAESYILASLQHPSEPSTQPVGGCVGVIHTHTHTHTHSQSWLVTCPYVIGTRPATELTAGQFHVTVSYLYSLPSNPLCERACFARRARKGSLGRARKRGGAAHTAPLHTNSHPPSPFVGAGEYPGGIGRAGAPVASLRRAEAR